MMNTIKDHLNEVRENIRKACEKSGRSPKEVTLIAVSKTKPLFMLEEAYEAGVKIKFRRSWKSARGCRRMQGSI